MFTCSVQHSEIHVFAYSNSVAGLIGFLFFVSLLKNLTKIVDMLHVTCLHTWIMAIHRKKFTLQKSFRQEQEKLVDFLLTIWVNDYVKNDGRFFG